MGNPVTLQRLLAMQKKIWRFRLDTDAETAETVAREQLKSISQISRIGSLISIPGTSYILIKICMHANIAFAAFTIFCVAVMAFASIRNYRRQARVDHDRIDYEKSARMIVAEAKLNAAFASALVAVPLAFGQIPMGLDVAILGIGTVIIGGFIFGSIPRAQSWYMGIASLSFTGGFLAAEGTAALGGVALFLFVTLCADYIYRMFFFNFVQRHIHAAREKKAADTVRLLLHDYAEQSSDWLWEIDEDFRIINPSARFASAAAREIRELRGRPLTDLFEDSTERNFLIQSLDSGEAFRDLAVPINIHGKLFWWKLSGRPTPGTNGSRLHIRGVAADITRAKLAEERVAHLAHFDSLTDLPNRALFNQSLQRSIARLKPGQKLAILYLDLDYFKSINDTLGHGAGDLVLKAVASRLEKAIGVEDVVARLGGDEFAISLRHISSDAQAKRQAASVIRKLSEPIMIEGQPVVSGASIGIAICNAPGLGADELLKSADIALYHAKNNGRSCVSVFEESMGTAFQDRRNIELDLRSALQRNELELRYQPLVNIESGDTIGYEALLRWHHPERGLIMPNAFIPVAEETGLIVQLGEWVLRSALQELCNWPDHLSVAVNLSPSQMRSPNLIPTIVSALAATGVDPSRLELEITESVLMSDSQNNVELLHKIRSLGVRIALDDFGTGYSSLNYLRSFPFDKIKIDRCFVEDVDSREDCRAIIRAVTGLASSLGMVTTAEGVERDGQLDQLKEDGCVQVQGYLFSKALPATEVQGRVPPDVETGNPAENIHGDRDLENSWARPEHKPGTDASRKTG
ncbi:PAS domain S-box-containing protein/diguanylate cyclase (GGDEF) domain-containing protein [Parasphingorhabdus marina DSM 22363]|uniref:PAS domain S-box-containing protein/diguanylate cyclase (GGDEF) domain-containing protein n=1 Tax=Parasphingorhabdus marina DSM 22363 TaxID=1123272 RepID=A0A1N6CU58_9SPHN|nr:EAL domain-containing protein [Parasphingorhabdus marina]SIN62168.1 PAS domain S-box-containing protein/diguanylate cyclase (GGDEF) domain-containing protein [Parasphingorhabdus marina DSM 22363]